MFASWKKELKAVCGEREGEKTRRERENVDYVIRT